MGELEDESGDSDTSPKTSPQAAIRPDALVLKSAMQRPHLDSQSQGYHLQTRDFRPHPSVTLDPATSFHPPPFRSRNQSYMRAVSTLSQASCVSQVSLNHLSQGCYILHVVLQVLHQYKSLYMCSSLYCYYCYCYIVDTLLFSVLALKHCQLYSVLSLLSSALLPLDTKAKQTKKRHKRLDTKKERCQENNNFTECGILS
ncbi:hypothetical protein XENORESO_003078 [Xenotaenia resolanae]|uniref:Uncharacterized protein n=1 Tax=Xenotaenia resolanae TaxID=208358 RepID=A0ABV0WIL5_9TELE